MEILPERKFMSVYDQVSMSSGVFEESCDIVVPDTSEDIQRVLLTGAKYRLRSKDYEDGNVVLRGDVELFCSYIPEAGGRIMTLSSVIPFEIGLSAEGAGSESFALCGIKIVSAHTRVLNPRKVNVKVKMYADQSSYCVSDFVWYEKPEESEKNVFFKTEEIAAVSVSTVAEKTFSVDAEFDMPELSDADEVICTEVRCYSDSADAVGAKLIIKGHAEIEILYHKNGNIEKALRSTAFSQVFENAERDTVPEYSVRIMNTGDSFELRDGTAFCELHGAMQLICIQKKAMNVLTDAYACRRELTAKREDIRYISDISTAERVESCRLNHETADDISIIEYTKVYTDEAKLSGDSVKLPISAEVIYVTVAGELSSARINGEIRLEAPAVPVSAEPVSVRTAANGREIILSLELRLRFNAVKNETVSSIASFELAETVESEPKPSVYLSRAGGDLWELAKRYGSSKELIAEINGLEGSECPSGKLVLIPRI